VREAKARLSQLLRDVRRGQEWVITERGSPVARLSPIVGRSLSLAERMRRLEDSGLVEPLRREARVLPPPLPLEEGLAQKWLQEDRGS
jgi:prevent-host-death family protein